MSSDLRVSRRANADPVIEELNVGDAAEPQGRGTGRPSSHWFFMFVFSSEAVGVVKVFCSQQVVP